MIDACCRKQQNEMWYGCIGQVLYDISVSTKDATCSEDNLIMSMFKSVTTSVMWFGFVEQFRWPLYNAIIASEFIWIKLKIDSLVITQGIAVIIKL